MSNHARLRVGVVILVCLTFGGARNPSPVSAAAAMPHLTATLDGKPLDPKRVADYFCDDFSYPVIRCFTASAALESRVSGILAASAIDYVTIYDFAAFAGTYMYVSQDYTVLAVVGWNDRVGSFIARDGQTNHFYTDWFYQGTSYAFCCYSAVAALGGYDNSFSSVHRQ